MGSACGVCGRTSIESVLPTGRPALPSNVRVAAELLRALPEKLTARQSVFARDRRPARRGLFDAAGSCAISRGHRPPQRDRQAHRRVLRRGELPLSDALLLVSGRAGFEIVQKAFGAGIPILAAVSAPSSLAVALAESAGVTLVGFLRGRRFNVYTHPRRIA